MDIGGCGQWIVATRALRLSPWVAAGLARAAVACLLVLLGSAAPADSIYRSVDAAGRVSFSDRNQDQPLAQSMLSPTAQTVAQAKTQHAAAARFVAARAAERQIESRQLEQAQLQAQARQRSCDRARAHVHTYSNVHRVESATPGVYLSRAERDQLVSAWRQAVAERCES
ncbi:MAG: DUF4124 domain-containing protein [Pseudomonadota bacterium]|nr:DUF4124 domain-containing protein [Pseudomonadota bacterium]